LSALYIEKSLVDYKKGARHDRRMSLIAQGLKKSQIKDLAAWYAAFEVTAKVPEI
jgi:cytochrome c553